MRLALRLAARGKSRTSPNPMVGAVVVSNGRIVGQAYHRKAGEPHAEVLALHRAGPRARGATLYLTLEPCCHHAKRTPPCVPLLIAAQLRRVVVAMKDPNPLVHGGGIQALRRAGISISVGCLEEEAAALNRIYCHWIETGRPWVMLKAGMTLDGKIATARGESQWITGPDARRNAHRLRSEVDAILTGVGTVQADDPRLTVRLVQRKGQAGAVQPLRVIADSRLTIPATAAVLSYRSSAKTLIATTTSAPLRRVQKLRSAGIEVWQLPAHQGRVPMARLLRELGRRGIASLLVEGGGTLNAALWKEGLVNEVRLFVAPMLLGGQDAKSVLGGTSPARLADAVKLQTFRVRKVGSDWLLAGLVPTRSTTRHR
jgi:diaminohydroxyphosphoribosylaminopyrimidine deaminase/5-amino-6-(5-phosphoribosylamino)uracil reductase